MIPPPDPVIDAAVQELVRNAAPLTPAEKDILAVLLRPADLPVVNREPRRAA